MFFGLFGSSSAQLAQMRAAKSMAAIQRDQERMYEESRMAKVQALAYDAERWPHCIDLQASSRHDG
jgi:hypothetical protein